MILIAKKYIIRYNKLILYHYSLS